MRLTTTQKSMAASAHAANQLRNWLECRCDYESKPVVCFGCLASFMFLREDEYNPGWTVGRLVRWMDSI